MADPNFLSKLAAFGQLAKSIALKGENVLPPETRELFRGTLEKPGLPREMIDQFEEELSGEQARADAKAKQAAEEEAWNNPDNIEFDIKRAYGAETHFIEVEPEGTDPERAERAYKISATLSQKWGKSVPVHFRTLGGDKGIVSSELLPDEALHIIETDRVTARITGKPATGRIAQGEGLIIETMRLGDAPAQKPAKFIL